MLVCSVRFSEWTDDGTRGIRWLRDGRPKPRRIEWCGERTHEFQGFGSIRHQRGGNWGIYQALLSRRGAVAIRKKPQQLHLVVCRENSRNSFPIINREASDRLDRFERCIDRFSFPNLASVYPPSSRTIRTLPS